MSGRNVFENNEPPITSEEAMKYGGKMHSTLPPARAGYHYELVKLESGQVAVIIEQG